MKMKVKINKVILLSMIILALGACKTKKQLIKTEIPAEMTAAQMVEKLQEKQPAFTSAYIDKMTVDVDVKNRQMTVNATCKMRTDSAIHLSIQPFFGIELFKLELTPYNIILIDKTNKMYYRGQYSMLRSRFGVDVDYKSIQALISNRLFVAGNRAFLTDDFKWRNDSATSGVLAVQGERTSQEVTVNPALERIIRMVIKTNDNAYTLNTDYSGFKNFDKQLFPENINIEALNAGEKASFLFRIERVEFDKPLVMEPANLQRYRQGDFSRFLTK